MGWKKYLDKSQRRSRDQVYCDNTGELRVWWEVIRIIILMKFWAEDMTDKRPIEKGCSRGVVCAHEPAYRPMRLLVSQGGSLASSPSLLLVCGSLLLYYESANSVVNCFSSFLVLRVEVLLCTGFIINGSPLQYLI